jgi:hypothetical protein
MPHIFTKSFKTLTRRFKPGDSVGAGDLDGPLRLADLEAGGFVELAEQASQAQIVEEAPQTANS